MNIQTLSKKPTWELKLMVKALSSPVSLFLNDEKAEERLIRLLTKDEYLTFTKIKKKIK